MTMPTFDRWWNDQESGAPSKVFNTDEEMARAAFEAGKAAQVEQEPVAWVRYDSAGFVSGIFANYSEGRCPLYAAPPAHAVPEWISVDARLPEVELGGEMHCFVAIRNKASGKVRAIDSYWCNKPSDPEWDETVDAPDWALQTVDDGYLNLVGWAEITHHPDYSGYYEPIDECYAEVIAWQQIVYPASPEPTK